VPSLLEYAATKLGKTVAELEVEYEASLPAPEPFVFYCTNKEKGHTCGNKECENVSKLVDVDDEDEDLRAYGICCKTDQPDYPDEWCVACQAKKKRK
jgi:hypothetical protein